MRHVIWLVFMFLLAGCYLNSSLLDLDSKNQKGDLPSGSMPSSLTVLNYPKKVSSQGLLDISVSATNIPSFKYKVGPASAIDCRVQSGYSANEVSIGTKINDDLSGYADQLIKLCVVGVSEGGKQDDLSHAVVKTWYLDRVPTIINLAQSEEVALETDGANKTITATIDVAKPYDLEIQYSLSGDAAYLLNHNLAPKGTITIPAGQSSGSLIFQTLNDSAGTATKFFQFNTDGADFGLALLGNIYQSRFFVKDVTAGARPTAVELSMVSGISCVRLSDGAIKCWGTNARGQNGNGTTSKNLFATSVAGGLTYSNIGVAGDSVCAITTTGALQCWGGNSGGQVGDGTSVNKTVPTVIDSGVNYTFLLKHSSSGNRTCGITSANVLKCWGQNDLGQVGDGSYTNRSSPTVINSGVPYQFVNGSDSTTCGITTAGVLKCWGSNFAGQVGDGSVVDRPSPVVIDSGVTYSYVATPFAYETTTCGITTAGVLKCWGNNYYGQIGDGTTVDKLSPTVVDSGTQYSSVALAGGLVCGITSTAVLKCWGNNSAGQLGDGTTVNRTTPVVIDSGVSYSKIFRGGDAYSYTQTTCGITTTGVLKCWGVNNFGQLGLLATANTKIPNIVDPGVSYTSIKLIDKTTCGITISGEVKCWGSSGEINQGDGGAAYVLQPAVIDSQRKYSSLSSTGSTNCAITVDSELRCWGDNVSGQLGDGTKVNKAAPVVIDSGVKYVLHTGHTLSSCGLTSTGDIKCWGLNDVGQLGDGTLINKTLPVLVDSGTKYSYVNTRSGTTCGITVAGVLKCWGRNTSAQLGDNTVVNKSSPIVVDSGTSYKHIVLGGSFLCGLTTANVIKCWGYNGVGSIGDGTTTDRPTPVVVNAGTTYSAVAISGNSSVCGITTAGVLKCWGGNLFGSVGDGTTVNKTSPTVIDGGTMYEKLIMSDGGTCAKTTSGILKCWGYNGTGSVGDGTTATTKMSPTVADGGTEYAKVFSNGLATCGITSAPGSVLRCWGSNGNGVMGNGNQVDQPSPIVVDPGVSYADIHVNNETTTMCGITTAGVLKCWGSNGLGAVGDGTAFFASFPKSISRWITP